MQNSRDISLKSVIFWAACIALAASLLLFVLEKTRVINLYTKPATDTPAQETSRPVNTVDYSPASDAEVDEGQAIKEEAAKQGTGAPSTPSKSLEITLSAAGQDNPGGPVIIRTIVSGATGGNCTIKLVKGTTTKTYKADIASQGTYYACNTNIPFADVSNGEWQLEITATQDSASGTAAKTITIAGT